MPEFPGGDCSTQNITDDLQAKLGTDFEIEVKQLWPISAFQLMLNIPKFVLDVGIGSNDTTADGGKNIDYQKGVVVTVPEHRLDTQGTWFHFFSLWELEHSRSLVSWLSGNYTSSGTWEMLLGKTMLSVTARGNSTLMNIVPTIEVGVLDVLEKAVGKHGLDEMTFGLFLKEHAQKNRAIEIELAIHAFGELPLNFPVYFPEYFWSISAENSQDSSKTVQLGSAHFPATTFMPRQAVAFNCTWVIQTKEGNALTDTLVNFMQGREDLVVGVIYLFCFSCNLALA